MECVEIMLCRLCTDDFPVNFIEGYQREPGSGQTAVLTLPGCCMIRSNMHKKFYGLVQVIYFQNPLIWNN